MSKKEFREELEDKREFLLRPNISRARSICIDILETAVRCGVSEISLKRIENYYLINSSDDWVSESYPGYIFDRLVPNPGQQNSFRGEGVLPLLKGRFAVIKNSIIVQASDGNSWDAWDQIVKGIRFGFLIEEDG